MSGALASTEAPSLIEFPSAFPIKVLGLNEAGFVEAMVAMADIGSDEAGLNPNLRPSPPGKVRRPRLSRPATGRA